MPAGRAVFRLCQAVPFALGLFLAGNVDAAELLTGLAGAKPSASGSVRSITLAEDWQVTCDSANGDQTCRMATTGSGWLANGGTIVVQLTSESPDGLFYFLTPLDLLVAKGVEMRIDGDKALKLAYRSCHAQGCVIPFRITGTLDRSFQRGAELSLRMFELDGSPVDVEMSLIGFIAASRLVRHD
jgi:invasion protein IalB